MSVRSGRLRIGSGIGRRKRGAELGGILSGEAEGGPKDPRFVLATRMLGVQALRSELLQVDDGGITARQFHRASTSRSEARSGVCANGTAISRAPCDFAGAAGCIRG